MNRFIPVKDKPGYFRDSQTGGIVNMNAESYNNYKKKRDIIKTQLAKEQLRDERINSLEKDIAEVKHGISAILEMLKNGNN